MGANGTGKSSLLKVLAGIEGLDSGVITTQKGVSIGYLPQEGLSLSGRTVFAECMTVFAALRELEEEQAAVWPGAWRNSTRPASSTARWRTGFITSEASFRARDGVHRRIAGGRGAQRPRILRSATGSAAPRSSPAAGRCASRWPNCCSKNPTCCCWMSPPTTWTWRRATGWKSTSALTRTPSSWSRTTATSWTSPCARSSNSGTRGCTFYTAVIPSTRS